MNFDISKEEMMKVFIMLILMTVLCVSCGSESDSASSSGGNFSLQGEG
jgi:hypothetical protein